MENTVDPASVLLFEVRDHHPIVYREILQLLKPHKIESLVRILREHLENCKELQDLNIFNQHRNRIPNFLLRFVQCIVKKIPAPGDAFGIQLTCRITKNDTQNTLDSRHLREATSSNESSLTKHHFTEEDLALKYELQLFSKQCQILELAGRRKFSSIFVRGYTDSQLLHMFQNKSFMLDPYHKNWLIPLSRFRFLIVQHGDDIHRIIYSSHARDLSYLLRHLQSIVAFNDVKHVYQKCGISCFFFNMLNVVRLVNGSASPLSNNRDLFNVIKYQCQTGIPLPLNRDGLAKHTERSPLEVLSFEAPKKNYVRLSTTVPQKFPVSTSTDKMYFGQQFNEGTGYKFSVLPRTH